MSLKKLLSSRKQRFINGLAARALRGRPFTALPPFSFWSGHRSTLSGEGGETGNPFSGSAFRTEFVPSSGERIAFRVMLRDLTGIRGKLRLTLSSIDPDGKPGGEESIDVSIKRLAGRGGKVIVTWPAKADYAYSLGGTLIGACDVDATSIEIGVHGLQDQNSAHARLRQARESFLEAPAPEDLEDIIVTTRASLEQPISQMCTANQMEGALFAELCAQLGMHPSRHRKQWEFVYILSALRYYGALRPGARGLVFGVGMEMLPAHLASLGCEIVATDLPCGDDRAQLWQSSSQLSSSLRQLHHPALCAEADFFARVSFRPVDMNAIPDDLTDFDFTWSSCAFEHLGSIEAGLRFYERALDCLKPGGIAVHTTELNLTSNNRTLDDSSTVLFRRRDFEDLARRLIARKHEVMPITFDPGDGDLDQVIDMPPYANDPHLKLALLSWVTTSFGFITRRAGIAALPEKMSMDAYGK